MSYRKGNKFGYSIFTKVVWFDFTLPDYMFGRYCVLEFIDTEYLAFKVYLN